MDSHSDRYKALWVEETSSGQFTRRIAELPFADLPLNEVLVRVKYSSLNYKDALSATGNKGVTPKYPHTPGIDAAGVVESSDSPKYKPGDEVLVSSGNLGVNVPGGFGQYVRVPEDWLIPLPKKLSLRQSMAYGTAGFTAGLCVDRLEEAGVEPDQGTILVTGATGGVGSFAVAFLACEGFKVTAATGKIEHAKLLRALGASEVISREELDDTSGRPLLHARWAGVVDTVGGNYLATAIRETQPNGIITACGNAASPDLPLTVFPFILRGVSLLGIDTTRTAYKDRVGIWKKLASAWKLNVLDEMAREVPLEENGVSPLEEEIQRMLKGGQTGRVIVNLGE